MVDPNRQSSSFHHASHPCLTKFVDLTEKSKLAKAFKQMKTCSNKSMGMTWSEQESYM